MAAIRSAREVEFGSLVNGQGVEHNDDVALWRYPPYFRCRARFYLIQNHLAYFTCIIIIIPIIYSYLFPEHIYSAFQTAWVVHIRNLKSMWSACVMCLDGGACSVCV